MEAAHLVGGEITYECKGNFNYEVTLIMYRDCFSGGAPFDDTARITVHNASNIVVANLKPVLLSSSQLPLIAPNNCTTLPNTVCVEKAIYKITINLPPIPGGYSITHQRCCRNATIVNIPDPEDWGTTYTVSIPSNDNACNSSPFFNTTPPVVLCVNQNLNLDMSASETDGDSLSYSLCRIKHGGGKDPGNGVTSPAPIVAAPPPYTNIPFNPNFSFSNPITSNPTLQINSATGFLSGRPTQLGQYVFAVCVNEYRNGLLISTITRDFQFNVSGDCKGPISQIEDQVMNPATLCIGRTIQFKSISANASFFHWDFGDPNSTSDTSSKANPIYTYADTGIYKVTLVANPNSCPDTNQFDFRVYYPVNVDFNVEGEGCFPESSLDFSPSGTFSANATFSWDFGGLTSAGLSSTLKEPNAISFDEAGAYDVTVTVTDFECSAAYTKTVYVYPHPVLNHFVPEIHDCAPVMVEFSDSSVAFGLAYHTWIFGDGATSNDKAPIHEYTEPGIYTVQHYIITTQGCIDSVYGEFPMRIEVFPAPDSELKIEPLRTSIYDPVVNIQGTTEGNNITTETILPDGRVITNLSQETLTFEDTGTYELIHIAFNQFGCSDTIIQNIIIDAPVNLFIPSAFTPNGDGVNDEFFMSITGITAFEISIFNRWGQMVFQSNDQSYIWNGNVSNIYGKPSDSGSYSYRVKVRTKENARDIVKHGIVTLLR